MSFIHFNNSERFWYIVQYQEINYQYSDRKVYPSESGYLSSEERNIVSEFHAAKFPSKQTAIHRILQDIYYATYVSITNDYSSPSLLIDKDGFLANELDDGQTVDIHKIKIERLNDNTFQHDLHYNPNVKYKYTIQKSHPMSISAKNTYFN